jgi:hypothetical protein
MKKILALAFAATLSVSACSQIEYSIALEEDLSGTAALDMSIDMEQMAYVLASMTKAFTGDTMPVSDEELASARDELMAEMDKDDWDEEDALQSAREDMPDGVEMIEFSNSRDGMKQRFSVRLAFDHISKLNEVAIDPDDATGAEGGAAGADTQPFGGLEVVEEGNTIVLRNDPLDPIADQVEDASGQMPGMEGMLESALAEFSVVFRIEAPFDVVEHNATRQEGNALIWEYDASNLEGGSPGVFVRYER